MANPAFGIYLRKTRLEAGMSQQALAELVSVDRSYISQIERNEKVPSTDTLRKIAKELNVKVSEFIDLLDDIELKVIETGEETNPLGNKEEPEYLVYLSADENLPPDTRELMTDIIRKRYAQIKQNAEELRKIPPGINRPARIIKPE